MVKVSDVFYVEIEPGSCVVEWKFTWSSGGVTVR